MEKGDFLPPPENDEPMPPGPLEQLVYAPQFFPDPMPAQCFEKTSPFPSLPPPPPLPPPYPPGPKKTIPNKIVYSPPLLPEPMPPPK